MKKIYILLLLSILALTTVHTAHAQQVNEYYLGVFSNTTNTVKFTLGAYPYSINQSKKNDGSFYTAMSVAIINNANASPLPWNDYKIYILLKDGTLFYNFLTDASSGDYACNYQVAPGTTHMQYYCFDKVFSASDIDKVWLCLSDSEFKSLYLYKDEVPVTKTPAETPSKKSQKK